MSRDATKAKKPVEKMSKSELLELIELEARFAVAQMEPEHAHIGKIYPRDKIAFWWKVREIHLWRLPHLYYPLWLGSDGVIYRAFDRYGESRLGPIDVHHWKRAEIELRDAAGLRRIVVALTDHLKCGCNYKPRRIYR